ncbi:unnamed protein product [Mytilus edulis]|uniref:Uncharacterized protein n=1 Tax=Mytilus edulis TaxID=6550 RepID=A0A8S3Q820_MYTED|nr:unnamed protein product [Mytilus edulis]
MKSRRYRDSSYKRTMKPSYKIRSTDFIIDSFELDTSNEVRKGRYRKVLFNIPGYTFKDVLKLRNAFYRKGEYMILSKHNKGKVLRVFFVFKANESKKYFINCFRTRCKFYKVSKKYVTDLINFCVVGSDIYEEFGCSRRINRGRRNDLINAIEDLKNGVDNRKMYRKYKGTWRRYRKYIRTSAENEKRRKQIRKRQKQRLQTKLNSRTFK